MAIDSREQAPSQVQKPQATPIAREPVFRHGPLSETKVMTSEENKNYVGAVVDKAPENYPPQNEPVSVLAGFKRPEPLPLRPDHTPISPLPFVQEPPIIFPDQTKRPDVLPDTSELPDSGEGISLDYAQKIVAEIEKDLAQEREKQKLPQTEVDKKDQKKRIMVLMWKRLRPVIVGGTLLALALFAKEKVADVNQPSTTGGEANQPVAEQFNPNLVQTTGEQSVQDVIPDVPASPAPQVEKSAVHLVDYTIQPGDNLSSIIARFNPNKGYLDENGVFKMDDTTQAQLYNDVADVIGNNPQILEWDPNLAVAIAQETESLGASPKGLDLKSTVRKVGGPNEVVNIQPGATIKVPSQAN